MPAALYELLRCPRSRRVSTVRGGIGRLLSPLSRPWLPGRLFPSVLAAAIVAMSVLATAGAASADQDESLQVRISARKSRRRENRVRATTMAGRRNLGNAPSAHDSIRARRRHAGTLAQQLATTYRRNAGAYLRAKSRRRENRVRATPTADDGTWGSRHLPTMRFVPADATQGRWLNSSPLTLVETTATTTPTEWTLLAAGDVLMNRTEPAGIDPFEGIEPPLASGDLAVVNVEMAISDRGTPIDKQFTFRAPSSAAQRIADAGIDVANLANNHAKDYGPEALKDTIASLEAAGVVALGAGVNDVEAFRHRVLEINEAVKVAFVGVSRIVPWSFPAGPDSPGIASDEELERVLGSVRIASVEADVVIAVVHWGIEVATCPSADQRAFAQILLDTGADAVIGHHPHVLQAIEFVDGKLVAYSLGNFVWHSRWRHHGGDGPCCRSTSSATGSPTGSSIHICSTRTARRDRPKGAGESTDSTTSSRATVNGIWERHPDNHAQCGRTAWLTRTSSTSSTASLTLTIESRVNLCFFT